MEEVLGGGEEQTGGRMGGKIIIDEEDVFKRRLPGGISIHGQ